MEMTKEAMRESIVRAVAEVRETRKTAEATLPEDDESELTNELVFISPFEGELMMMVGWNEHELESVYTSKEDTFDVDAAIAIAWPGLA